MPRTSKPSREVLACFQSWPVAEYQAVERVVQRVQGADEATRELDRWVDRLLEKRRWLRARKGVQ